MTLLLDELYPSVIAPQPFRIKNSIQLAHLRPWIIKWGTPTGGDLVLQVYQNNTLLIESRLTADEINAAAPATYAHGHLRFDFPALQLNHDRNSEFTEYEWRLSTEGIPRDPNNFYGSIRRYEAKIYETYGDGVVDGEAPNDTVEPFGFELYEWKR